MSHEVGPEILGDALKFLNHQLNYANPLSPDYPQVLLESKRLISVLLSKLKEPDSLQAEEAFAKTAEVLDSSLDPFSPVGVMVVDEL